MKKKNLATAMAAAMMFGGVAPVVAHADEKTNVEKDAKAVAPVQVTPEKAENLAAKPTVVNVSLVNAQANPVVMNYSQVYNTEGTLTTSDDKLALNENQEILYADGQIGNTLGKETTAKYIVATKMSEEQIKKNKDEIEAAKVAYANAKANMEALKNLTFVNKDGKTVPVYEVTDVTSPQPGKELNSTDNTKRTITFKNQEEGNGFAKEIVFEFYGVKLENHVQKVEAQMQTLAQVLAGKGFDKEINGKDVTLNVAEPSGIVGEAGLNKLAYELSKVYNDKNTEIKTSEVYDEKTDTINKTVTIYEKGTNNELGKIILNGYDKFKKDNFKGFINIPEIKDLSSLNQPELSWAKDDVLNALFNAQINGYEDHTLRLENGVTRAEFAKMIVEMRNIQLDKKAKKEFSDVNSSEWFYNYVATLANKGIINGDGDGTFRPNDTITRQEAAVILAKTARIHVKNDSIDVDRFNDITGQPYDTKTKFADDANIALWSDGSVHEMAKNNVIKGYEDGTFRPDKNITRAESIVMISRIKQKAVTADKVQPEPIKVVNNEK